MEESGSLTVWSSGFHQVIVCGVIPGVFGSLMISVHGVGRSSTALLSPTLQMPWTSNASGWGCPVRSWLLSCVLNLQAPDTDITFLLRTDGSQQGCCPTLPEVSWKTNSLFGGGGGGRGEEGIVLEI